MQMNWKDPENLDKLRHLLTDLCMSSSQAATHLGITKGSVMGAAHRNGIALRLKSHTAELKTPEELADPSLCRSNRAARYHRNGGAIIASMIARHSRPARLLPQEPEPELPFCSKDLREVGVRDCHFPHGDGPFLFCGQPIIVGSPYCSFHHSICHKAA